MRRLASRIFKAGASGYVSTEDDGTIIYSPCGGFLTQTVQVRNSTKVIDGKFADWNSNEKVPLYITRGNCSDNSGGTIQKIYVTEDSDYIYIRMILDGIPDSSFRFKFGDGFHIRVVSPPISDMGIASSDLPA